MNLCFCFLLSFSFVHFIGLLYFIDDVDETLAQICPSCETIDLWKRLARSGPEMTADYIKQHLNRWKAEKIKFAVLGRSAAGKSTFINVFRGLEEDQKGFADVGFGDTGKTITEYKHPVNENIIFCDVPGLSMQFNKSKFQKMVNLSSYNYIFLFFESVLTEDDEWLMVQIQKKSIPFCLVRSKVDSEVNSNKGRKVSEKGTLLKIRETIKDSLSDKKAFAKAELFLISYVKVFGLDQRHKENIEGLQYDFSVVSVDDFVLRKISANGALVPATMSGQAIIKLVFNSVQVARETRTCVDGFLFNILSELRQDAITVYMHFLKQAHPLATDDLLNA